MPAAPWDGFGVMFAIWRLEHYTRLLAEAHYGQMLAEQRMDIAEGQGRR